jgi:hypothetical protein
MDRVDLVIARDLGQPIDPNLNVPVAIAEIANVETAEPGELVRIFNASDEDANADDIYSIDSNGKLTAHKLSAVTPATLVFSGLQSKLEYVLINEVLPAADQNALARKKAGISRAMDKQEVKRICDAVLSLPACETVQATDEDLYDLIAKMAHQVEDYATDYVLLVGSSVKEAIDLYDKVNADNFQYRVGLDEYLRKIGVKVIKMVGKVNGGAILAADTLILVGRNSQLAAGRPITFVRRKFSPEIAAMMNVVEGSPVRAISVAQAPTIIASDTNNNLLGYGVFGYESIIETITNYRAIAWATYVA